MADSKLSALTAVSVPALDDILYGVDKSDTTDDAAGSSRQFILDRVLALLAVCQGRLTTESGVPVSTSDRTAQSTIYFTPFNGNKLAVYDGTRWKLYAFTEISLALSGLTSGLNYDVFVYDNSGTLTLELTAWTNDTTRATALTTQDGVLVKTGALTRRYLGTIRTTSTTATEDSAAKRFVWNAYNQVTQSLSLAYLTDHTYASSTYRYIDANSANKIEWVTGLASTVQFSASGNFTTGVVIALALNWASGAYNPATDSAAYWSAANLVFSYPAMNRLAAGYRYAALIEAAFAGSATIYDANATGWLNG